MLPRKALMIPAAASGALLVVLAVTGWGGDADTAAPAPSPSPTSSTSAQVNTTTPAVAAITVKTTTTTPPPPPPTTTTTTEVPPPPPQQVRPPVEPTEVSETPDRGLIVPEGAPCRPEGAIAVSPKGEPLVCRKNDRDRLRWQAA